MAEDERGGLFFLKKPSEAISVIDTMALGVPRVVASYLVKGKETALIDMGYASSSDAIKRRLKETGIRRDGLDYLLPTHVHLDHCGSCGTLSKEFPRASVRAHPKGVPHLADPTRLVQSASELFGNDLMRRYRHPVPIDSARVRSVADDELIDLGEGLSLRAVWTPGHASHHLSYVLEGTGRVFTGDAVGVLYPDFPTLVPTTPPTSFNLEQAIASLNRLRGFSPSHFCTPHFGILTSAAHRIDENLEGLLTWKDAIGNLVDAGKGVDDIAESMAVDIAGRLGHSSVDVPEHLRVLIRVNVLGYIGCLTRKR
jgi:glyoxylase-like metal-dependent hydrolase (beta-lactamase superfamily II)